MVGINTPRTQIALPAQGVEELRDTLSALLDEFGNEDDKGKRARARVGKPQSDIYPHTYFKRRSRWKALTYLCSGETESTD